jgi:hypothetical protein
MIHAALMAIFFLGLDPNFAHLARATTKKSELGKVRDILSSIWYEKIGKR